VDIGGSGDSDAVWSAAAALVAFFLGGVTAGATSMWRGADDGFLHGIVLWAAGLVSLLVLSLVGTGVALGSFDTTAAFSAFTADNVNLAQANDAAQDAAWRALLGLIAALVAASIGGAAGSKMWPRRHRDEDLDLRTGTAS
jgi:hypothetical protein